MVKIFLSFVVMGTNVSAGILLYRIKEGRVEVLLVHPGGPYFKGKDLGHWSVPKGLVNEAEDMLDAAKREFFEELGQELNAETFVALKPVKQKGGKWVYVWIAEGDADTSRIKSNTFRMEYPYKSGKWIEVPEIDAARWFPVEEAKQKINAAQSVLVDELLKILSHEKDQTE